MSRFITIHDESRGDDANTDDYEIRIDCIRKFKYTYYGHGKYSVELFTDSLRSSDDNIFLSADNMVEFIRILKPEDVVKIEEMNGNLPEDSDSVVSD